MIGRIVEIAENGRHLAADRGFLRVLAGSDELGRVPLDDIAAVIANAHGLTYSNNLLLALVERGAAVVLCGPNHQPAAILWPVDSHHIQTARMKAQINAPLPVNKRLWQELIRAKIRQQGALLATLGHEAGAFDLLARQVRSGDPDNIEAQAARRYWPLLMGVDFRRDPALPGTNGLLNYGYAVLRALVARAVMAAGLHPSIGLHHRNRYNPMCLVDDVMEPFRPVVDWMVLRLLAAGIADVTRDAKRYLAAVGQLDMATAQGTTPLSTCAIRLTQSLATSFEEEKPLLELPLSPLPLDMPAVMID